jgi:hypothetical protein
MISKKIYIAYLYYYPTTMSINSTDFFSRYRAIMYPLRRKPSKLFSKIVILLIWIAGLAFALPMGLVHTFGYVDDPLSFYINEQDEQVLGEKPFCYIDFGSNATQSSNLSLFKYYR